MYFNCILLKCMFIFFINRSIAISVLELRCNFAKYLLNFFNFNGKYLMELRNDKEKLTEINLENYAKIIQSHGEIVMIMLKAMNMTNDAVYAYEIMVINLYLNNVSGSINDFVAIDKNGKLQYQDVLVSKLETFNFFHREICHQLKYALHGCYQIKYEKNFVYYFDVYTENTYDMKSVRETVECFKNEIFNNNINLNNEYLVNALEKLEETKTFTTLKLATSNLSYFEFHPRNFLFYYLMRDQFKIKELDVMNGSQARQYPKFINRSPERFIDFIRYAGITMPCPDGSKLTISDIFRYMKYSFNPKNLIAFQELIIAASFRPLAILVRYYLLFIRMLTYVYNLNDNVKVVISFKRKMIKILEEIILKLKLYETLNIFPNVQNFFFVKLYNNMSSIVTTLKSKLDDKFYSNINFILNLLHDFMDMNLLDSSFDFLIKIESLNFDVDNVQIVEKHLYKLFNLVTMYLEELKNYKNLFITVNKMRLVNFVGFSKHDIRLQDVIDRICNNDIYAETNNLNKENYGKVDKETINDNINNLNINNDNIKKSANDEVKLSFPKYMFDYVICK
ncbi:uncharacterized protein LOC126907244 isoform X2 [Daktulosphaira vitifoliae]|uniref:uncharacterized protein LOC126907244 isoform X2 n=1 Tax=Daktulosphaira vitifoliae TaxID=58002 RepID=UPI0021AAB1FA|nr:uncharacterized protein LOC126907244 isoform X2 [Daktulosphaira vitifoliae]